MSFLSAEELMVSFVGEEKMRSVSLPLSSQALAGFAGELITHPRARPPLVQEEEVADLKPKTDSAGYF